MLADELASTVTLLLEQNYEGEPPGIEEIQDTVEKVLIETGHARTAKAYILYRDRRARIRQSLQVRKPAGRRDNSTDIALLVNTRLRNKIHVKKWFTWKYLKLDGRSPPDFQRDG